MPKQGLQMTEGTITKWLVSEGEQCKEGEPLFEMETDKLTITMDANATGKLLKIVHGAGDTVEITKTIAIIGEDGEDISDLVADISDISAEATTKTEPTKSCDKYDYDTIVIGGGPGGYECAIRLSQLGHKTALIEARELGGTCLNRGCIPTKALLHAAEVYETVNEADIFGVQTSTAKLDFKKTVAFKDAKVSQLRSGIEMLEKKHGVTVINGYAILEDRNTVTVNNEKITASNIVIATGSAPARPNIPGINDEAVITSDEVLSMDELPDSFVIIGGGVIGIEFATLFSTLGKSVTVIEMMPDILPGVDAELTEIIKGVLTSKGVNIINNAKVLGFRGGKTVEVEYELGGQRLTVKADRCIVSIGRKPMSSNIGLENVGVNVSQRGFVDVDDMMKTNVDNIYAIGDVTGKIQLAHVASAQGMVAAANCVGKQKTMDYGIVPACIYTNPEIAYVGMSEEAAKKSGKKVTVGRFSVSGNGRAMVMNANTGLVKIVTDELTGEIYGAQMIGPRATDMIAEIAAVMKCEGTIDELADTIHPHPTVSEIIMEAAHDVHGLCCHTMPKRK